MSTFIHCFIHISDSKSKSFPSCCQGNLEEYSLVAMTTGDAHPLYSADFYLAAKQGAAVRVLAFVHLWIWMCEDIQYFG